MPRWERFEDFLQTAQTTPQGQRQALVDALLAEQPRFPWVEPTQATFIYALPGAERVALNLDTIRRDPPFAPLNRLEGTSLFYLTYPFAADDQLDYLLAVNDPQTPLSQERNLSDRIQRYWRPDPHNPAVLHTANIDVSILRMPNARPFTDWSRLRGILRGRTVQHSITSRHLRGERRVWVHLPVGYETAGLLYPGFIFVDGQTAQEPLQVTWVADALLKHNHILPVILVLVEGMSEVVGTGAYYSFVMTELLPMLQTEYRIDGTQLGIGGTSMAAALAAETALKNPAVFSSLMMLSAPLAGGAESEALAKLADQFKSARAIPSRVFQSVGRYESPARFYRPALSLAGTIGARPDTAYKFVELGSGHSMAAFRSILPEALAWLYPGYARV
ncbi:MAG: alpha/beta hydrolase-fold protein [Phototrophicaceae bacterium]|jgi:enterochelin esterase-like enzyme